jgi:PTH1 family peptidyl-tRNA hydrolase
MKLVIALGNAEPRYDNTRHNVGFWCVDAYAKEQGATWKQSDKFRAYIAEATLNGEKVILAKPTTYYNLVGESGRSIADFYKIAPEDILIIHDDFALPLGTLRTRLGGGDAGNNGIKSMTQHLGGETARLRIGTYTEHRDIMDDVDFVLGHFSKDEQTVLTNLLPKITGVINSFIGDIFESTTHK